MMQPAMKIALIGNYLPRKCGIATFTTDLHKALVELNPGNDCYVLAMNDPGSHYDYPAQVRLEIQQDSLANYKSAADFLNLKNPDVVCLQHEYGIFGGIAGSHILSLLQALNAPVVTTLHTVLRDPDSDQRKIMQQLAHISSRLVVMSRKAADFLADIYAVSPEKIDVIPHGIPDVPFTDPNFYKDNLNVEGKHVLLTFGLLSANKGIEYAIRALPEILTRVPNLVYIVLGATHPQVKRQEGERYRRSLTQLAEDLGVSEHVDFYDRFVELEELIEFIGAADIYITPYLNQAQIVSGTLAYTVGAGKAVISTPYWFAEELLAQGRGLFVPFRDPQAIATQVLHLLQDEAERHALRKRAYLYGREMIWSQVAQGYLESFAQAKVTRRQVFSAQILARAESVLTTAQETLPELRLDHLLHMTDDLGILQHAVFHLPNYAEGYTTDDNARALLLALQLHTSGDQDKRQVEALISRYLAFLGYAFNPATEWFRNFLSYDRRWLEENGSEDSQGRALWALGVTLGQMRQENLSGVAARLFETGLPVILETTSPRAWAYALLGIHAYLGRFSGDRAVRDIGETLAERLADLFRGCSRLDWPWFEEIVTYSNARLPHALLLASQWTGREEYARIGFESLDWLACIQTSPEGHFVPIGSNGFYRRGEEKARFDQQPVEAGAMVSAALQAYRMSRDDCWMEHAERAFAWFLGENDLGLPLYDPGTGGCCDGLHSDRVNRNQGAESTLAFLMALEEMRSQTQIESGQYEMAFQPSNLMHPPSIPVSAPLPGHNGRKRPGV
jgi:glycosyltransferase involved in cell wall biosynthesis